MPRTLEPNSPAKRLAYVLKTYANQPWVVAETALIVAMTIGVDRFEQWIDETTPTHLVGQAIKFIRQNISGEYLLTTRSRMEGWEESEELGYQQIIEHLFDLAVPSDSRDDSYKLTMAKDWNKEAAKFLVELLSSTSKGRRDHAADGLIPWIAQQVSKLYKARTDGRIKVWEVTDLLDELHKKSNAIAAWAKANRKDIGKVTLAEALEGAKDFEVTKTLSQGEIVHRFPDGYTIQMLREKEQLEDEGEVMQHCVGTYCEQVREGQTVIFSLRDEKGRPHVTMEWQPDWDQILGPEESITLGRGVAVAIKRRRLFEIGAEEFMRSDLRLQGHFVQIMGKQNEPPAEKYRPYVQEFIREKFDGDPQGMLEAGADVRELRLTNRVFKDVGFEHLDLQDTDWSGSTFIGTSFEDSDLSNAKFEGCTFSSNTNFGAASLKGAVFDRSATKQGRLASYTSLSFRMTHLEGASFDGVDFNDVSFNGSNLQGVEFVDSKLIASDFGNTELRSTRFIHCDLEGSNWAGAFNSLPHLDETVFEDVKGVPKQVLRLAREETEQTIDDYS